MPDRNDDDIDDASLKSMRAVWLSMRDEDPPAAGMSALLAAARDQAEQMRARPVWWQRLFAMLRKPPALAFATVMILIGGAVVVTRTSDKKVASLSAEEAPATELRLREADRQQAQPELDADAPSVAPVEEPPQAPEPVIAPRGLTADAPKDVGVAKPKPKLRAKAQVGAKSPDDQPGKFEPSRYDRFEDETRAKPGTSAGAGKGDSTTVLESPGRAAPQPQAPPPPPSPSPRSEPTKPTEPVSEAIVLSDRGETSTPPNEQLARQAESAASRGDCAAVRVIVARLKKQDERYFKTRLGKHAAVAKCL